MRPSVIRGSSLGGLAVTAASGLAVPDISLACRWSRSTAVPGRSCAWRAAYQFRSAPAALGYRLVKGPFCCSSRVIGGGELALGLLRRGLGFGQGILGCGEPAAGISQFAPRPRESFVELQEDPFGRVSPVSCPSGL